MTIKPVDGKTSKKQFLEVARYLYKDDKNWISPLDNDIEDIFNPAKNSFFQHGKCTRWILEDAGGRVIGRIAAFINDKKAYQYDVPTGGVGFFECINDVAAANTLFDESKSWLQSHGMEAMDGPINFGENDSFWGLLVEGFTPPSYGMNYNFPYYH
ncbi:MAG: GNAT family N-acetyltransferase, partial [Flavobacterium sp.]